MTIFIGKNGPFFRRDRLFFGKGFGVKKWGKT